MTRTRCSKHETSSAPLMLKHILGDAPSNAPRNAPRNAQTDKHTYKQPLTLVSNLTLGNARRGATQSDLFAAEKSPTSTAPRGQNTQHRRASMTDYDADGFGEYEYPGDAKAAPDTPPYPTEWTAEQRVAAYWYALGRGITIRSTATWHHRHHEKTETLFGAI